LFVALSFVVPTSFAQKKKSVKALATITSLAKADNLVAEVKGGNFQLTIDGKDAIIVKPVDAKFTPIDCKLTPFKASGTSLYLLTWTEKSQTKTDLKTEDIVTVYSNIYDKTTKKAIFENKQLTNNITEKVFLDKLKQASETQQKIHREGFEFKLNADGSVIQKNKTKEYKLVYNATKMVYQ
jgi:hypothetical protein